MKNTTFIKIALLIVLTGFIGYLILNTLIDESTNSFDSFSVEGTSTVTAEADLLVYSTSFEIIDSTQQTIAQDVANKANSIIENLTSAGIEDNDINIDTDSYRDYYHIEIEEGREFNPVIYLTVEVEDLSKAQDVADIITAQNATGRLTPSYTFTEETSEKLIKEARAKALANAKQKADQTAHELGFKLGKIKSVYDNYNNYNYGDYRYNSIQESAPASLDYQNSDGVGVLIQDDEVKYTVTVEYSF